MTNVIESIYFRISSQGVEVTHLMSSQVKSVCQSQCLSLTN